MALTCSRTLGGERVLWYGLEPHPLPRCRQANIHGGKVHGKWPGLTDLYENRDLAVTTDFRDVFAEVLSKHLGVTRMASVFPNYKAKPIEVL